MPVATFEIAVARHRPKREIFRVAVIAQKKDPGKARRGKTLFLPKSILRLGPRKIAPPKVTALSSTTPAAINPSKAHAVCDGVLGAGQ